MATPKHILSIALLYMAIYSQLCAQGIRKTTTPLAAGVSTIVFQADALSFFSGEVSLNQLQLQQQARISYIGDTAAAIKAGYKIISYRFILISASGPQATTILGSSLEQVKTMLKNAKPGDFIMFTDILSTAPYNPKFPKSTKVYLENQCATLKP